MDETQYAPVVVIYIHLVSRLTAFSHRCMRGLYFFFCALPIPALWASLSYWGTWGNGSSGHKDMDGRDGVQGHQDTDPDFSPLFTCGLDETGWVEGGPDVCKHLLKGRRSACRHMCELRSSDG